MLTLTYTASQTKSGSFKYTLLQEQMFAAIAGLTQPIVPVPPTYATVQVNPQFTVNPTTNGGVQITVPDTVSKVQVDTIVAAHDSTQPDATQQALTTVAAAQTSARVKIMTTTGVTAVEFAYLFGLPQ